MKRIFVVICCIFAVMSISLIFSFGNFLQGFNVFDEKESKAMIDRGQKSSGYHFPVEPLYNVEALVKENIGDVAMSNPVLNPFRFCSATVQYRLYIINHTDDPTQTTWLLQSMMLGKKIGVIDDVAGNEQAVPTVVPKTVGGDEIYVEWVSTSDMGVAFVTDRNDGTYFLNFTRPPLYQHNKTRNIPIVRIGTNNSPIYNTSLDGSDDESFGQLYIHYHYTCGVAEYYAREKSNFTRAGEVRETLTQSRIPMPLIFEFVPPNTKGTIDLSKYDVLFSQGDSLMREFFNQTFYQDKEHCDRHHNFPGCAHALSSKEDFHFFVAHFESVYQAEIEDSLSKNKSVGFITGSAVWDLLAVNGNLRPDMTDHLSAVHDFIAYIRTKFPAVDVFWKSPSAIHLHRMGGNHPLNSYFTAGELHRAQKQKMKELSVPYLDLYDTYYLSGAWTRRSDSMHYRGSMLPTLLVSYYWPGLLDRFDYCNMTWITSPK